MAYKVEKTTAGSDIVISGWEYGISSNPYTGIADMRNVDNVTIPGEVSVSPKTQAMLTQGAITAVTITVDPATNIFTYNGTTALEVNTAITFSNSGGALPGGLLVNHAYYILTIPTSTTFTIGDNAGGSTLDITDAGSGTNTFTTIKMGTPNYFASSPVNESVTQLFIGYFLVDSNGRCWLYDNELFGNTKKWIYMHNRSTEAVLGTGNGIVIYQNYLFSFNNSDIDVISLIDYSLGLPTLAYVTTRGNWNFGWKNIESSGFSGVSHQAIVSVNDDSVYFCDGQYVGSILTAITGIGGVVSSSDGRVFNIASTHTVADGVTTISSTSISTVTAFFAESDIGAVIVGTGIPVGAYIISVTDNKHATISANATASASGLTFTITAGNTFNSKALALPKIDTANCLSELGGYLMIGGSNSYIYPWDRVSVSFSNAIFLSENYVKRLVTVNTTMYIFCGFRGRIYQTNGSNVSDFWEVPEFLSGTTNPYFSWTDATFNRNQLYFGFTATINSGTTINQYGGLWTIDTNSPWTSNVSSSGGKLQNKLSYNTYAGYVSALVPFRGTYANVMPSNDGYGLFIGWNNGSTGGIDKGISTPYTGGESIIISDMIPVGRYLTKWTGNNLEFKLSTPLVSGESVSIAYRANISDAFVDVPITSGGGIGEISGISVMNFEKVQWLQLQITLTSTATNPSYVRLQEVRVR